MKILLTTLLSFLLIQPSAWAEPHTDPDEKLVKQERVVIEVEKEIDNQKDPSSKTQNFDKLFELVSKKIEAKAGDNLTDEERTELREGLLEAKEALREIDNITIGVGGDTNVLEMMIGMVAVILIFGGPLLIVAIALYSSYKKRRLTHQTINNYMESGKDIPAEIMAGLQKQSDPKSNLHKGVVLLGVGLGIFVCFTLIGTMEAGAFGLIPLFIGLAQLLVWKLENKNDLDT